MMNEYTFNLQISELKKGQQEIKEKLEQMITDFKPADDLWDNVDMMQKLKVSKRTLSDWRNKGVIGYTKIGAKIYYPKKDREQLLKKYQIK